MKRFLKILGLLILLVIIGLLVYFKLGKVGNIDALKLVPGNAMYVLDCEKPIKNWKELSSHPIWNVLKSHPEFADLTEDANYLDSLIDNNKTAFKLVGDRRAIISAHPTTKNNYDFLFIVDLKSGAKRKIVFKGIETLLKSSDYKIKNYTYHNVEILESTDNLGEKLAFAQIEDQLVCSYTTGLVEQSIEAFEKPEFAESTFFKSCLDKCENDGLAQLYVQYSMLDELMACYMTDVADIKTLGESMRFSCLDFLTPKNKWHLEGFSNLNPEGDSYLRAVLNSGKSDHKAGDVLSNRTAWYMSFNFNSFGDFRKNLSKVLKQPSLETAEFIPNQKLIEKLLGISVEEHLLGWIGNEVTVAQLRNNNALNKSDNYLILLRSEEIAEAQKKLNTITKHLKNRTPAKFRQIDYKNHQIQYLDIKGIFKRLFGKAFDKIEKPYFTILGDFVVFANNPQTLIGQIEDYENSKTLSQLDSYQRFLDDLSESSVTVYSNPQHLDNVLMQRMKPESRTNMAKSEKYFNAFESVGLTLVADGDMLKTEVSLRLNEGNGEEMNPTNEADLAEMYAKYASEFTANDSIPDMQFVEDGIYKKFFAGTDKIEIEAETKNGVLNGDYTEFYITGEKHFEGKYKKGRKAGTWTEYGQSGEELNRTKY
ncbi:MAG: DUF3352 domain-containing protein [Flavobacteriales bacterium]|nr:DUF3352 domain-containing protein [Flavobacteriales bacterium]